MTKKRQSEIKNSSKSYSTSSIIGKTLVDEKLPIIIQKTPVDEPIDFSDFRPTLSYNKTYYFKPSNPQCKKHNGTFYHIDYKNFGEEDPCLAKKENNLYFEDGDIESAPDGVYTWIVVFIKEGKKKRTPQIIACRVLTTSEVGTKHANLLDYYQAKNKLEIKDWSDWTRIYFEIKDHSVLGAGEFIKNDKNLKFNLLSGSYMRDKLTNFDGTTNFDRITRVKNDMVRVFETLTKLTISVEETEIGTYITEENIKLKKEDLLILLKCGAKIRKFETYELCDSFDPNYRDDDFDLMDNVPKFEELTEESLRNLEGGHLELVKHKLNRQTKRRKREKRNSKSRRNKSSRGLRR